MRKSKIPFKIILVICGMVIGGMLFEGWLWLFKGKPPRIAYDENLYWAYVDIYDPFFRKDKQHGVYVSQRPRCEKVFFAIKKAANEKRLFIIGESVAGQYDVSKIREKIKEIDPKCEWQVVNCGMGGYDSYRIKLVADEIAHYKPDMIIVMMGNNEGAHDPVQINDWIYRFPVLSRFWVSRIVTEFMNPAKPYNKKRGEINAFFEKNLDDIVRTFADAKIPLVLCTVPVNHKMPYAFYGKTYQDKKDFTLLWLAENNPRQAIRILSGQRSGSTQDAYLLARAYEKTGARDQAAASYRHNTLPLTEERNAIVRKTAERNKESVILADIEKEFMEISGGMPGFELFWDEVHYWDPVYDLISDVILRSLHEAAEKDVVARHKTYAYAGDPDIPALLQANKESVTEKYFIKLRNKIVNDRFDDRDHVVADMICILKGWYRQNPHLIMALRGRKEFVLERVHNRPDEKWSRFLACLGEALREEGEYTAAMACFDEALRADSTVYYTYLFRGLCFYDRHQEQRAEDDFRQLRRLRPAFDWLSVSFLRSPAPVGAK